MKVKPPVEFSSVPFLFMLSFAVLFFGVTNPLLGKLDKKQLRQWELDATNGREDKAIREITPLIVKNRKSSILYRIRGAGYLARLDWDLAIADLSRALELNDDDERAYALRGVALYLSGGDIERTEKDLLYAFKHKIYFFNTKHKDSHEVRSHMIGYYLGDLYIRKGAFEKALKIWNKVVENRPTQSFPLTQRASVYFRLGKLNAAFEDAVNAFGLDPRSLDACILMGRCEYHRGNFSQAKRHWERGIEIIESNESSNVEAHASVYLNYAAALWMLGDVGSALEFSEKAVQVSVRPILFINLMHACILYENNKKEQASAILIRLKQEHGDLLSFLDQIAEGFTNSEVLDNISRRKEIVRACTSISHKQPVSQVDPNQVKITKFGVIPSVVASDEAYAFVFDYEAKSVAGLQLSYLFVVRSNGTQIFVSDPIDLPVGHGVLHWEQRMQPNRTPVGSYEVEITLARGDFTERATTWFEVTD